MIETLDKEEDSIWKLNDFLGTNVPSDILLDL